MTLFLATEPDLSQDDNHYLNLSDRLVALREQANSKINAIMLSDSSNLEIDQIFWDKLSRLNKMLKSDMEEMDCHDAAYILMWWKKRAKTWPFDHREISRLWYSFVWYARIEAGEEWIFGCMDRIFNRDKLIKDWKIKIKFEVDGQVASEFDFKIWDMLTFSMIMNWWHSMTCIWKSGWEYQFISKLGDWQLSIHDLSGIYGYYWLSEALIFRGN
ncbi:MAG: hypothetical protein ACD_2C00192G0002 [uncultured bacterium (gcode 4)]|uniref:Uncharacterized protein n=1 Tax=uncultured bacterium (gcode 4) TaxID=1234023 RepID=K2G4Q7_9BACT|nr:MAG: hypothetical protein ACD_2C00192G0002 [uncultured bacterium (gcode 4)]